MSASDHFDFWISYKGPKNKKYVFFIFPRFHIWEVKTAFKVRVEKSFLWKKLTFRKSGESVIFRIRRHKIRPLTLFPYLE